MDFGLKNKVALVTGGNSGIGRATALAFAMEGAKVVVADIAGGEETADFIRKAGSDCNYVKTDISKPADVEAMIQKTIDSYGRLDCAVNCAGLLRQNFFLDCLEEEWDHMMAVNFKGTWSCMKHEIPPMLKQKRGAIVNISSIIGLVAAPKHVAYGVSKHGILGLTKSASVELVGQGIRVNAICPGSIDTQMFQAAIESPEMLEVAKSMTPLGRIGTPEELAAAVVFLCSDQASFISGITLAVDGGFSQH